MRMPIWILWMAWVTKWLGWQGCVTRWHRRRGYWRRCIHEGVTWRFRQWQWGFHYYDGPSSQDVDDEAFKDVLVVVDDSESNEDESVSKTIIKKQKFRKDSAEPDTFTDANMNSFCQRMLARNEGENVTGTWRWGAWCCIGSSIDILGSNKKGKRHLKKRHSSRENFGYES